MFGLFIILITMLGAVFILYTGIRQQTFNYFGRQLTRNEQPGFFWFGMGVAVLVLANGLWILPMWWTTLS
jgi:hypothetical protein